MSIPDPPVARSTLRHVVTAVVVAHEGQDWLPRVTAALDAQTVRPDRLIAIDTSSTDASAALLAQLVGSDGVVHAAPGTGFGAAVALALQTDARRHGSGSRAALAGARGKGSRRARRAEVVDEPPRGEPDHVEWLWLLHDDCEPAPDALERLLAFVEEDSSVAVVGPKVRGWHDRRLLLEVGVSIARSGRRETGLERREQDQGQHDGVHERLAVSTSGMFVRREVWNALGGLDRAFPLFRDDIDFGWRANLAGHRVVCFTDAVVYHAEAAARGRRPLAGTIGRRDVADRRAAISVLLFNLPLSSLPWALVRLLLGSILRAVSLTFGKAPRSALDELVALFSVLLRPDRVIRARLRRRRTRVRPARSALPLLANATANLRHMMESITSLLGVGPAAMVGAGAHRAVETGPGSEGADNLPFWGTVLVRRVLGRPPILLGLALILVTAAATRNLVADGRLLGGALLPAPDSATDLWRTYLHGWHPVGVGSDTPAAPYVAVVAALATILLGNASLAVDLLLLGAVPVAGLTFYLALRAVVDSVPLRLWGAFTYAFSPPLIGAVAAGRLGTAVLATVLPAFGVITARAIGGSGRAGSSRAAWGAALLLAVATSFTPVVYVLALVLAFVAIVFFARGAARRRLLVIVAVPPVLLAPWLPALAADPAVVLREAGLAGPGLTERDLPGWSLVLLSPGGPGAYPAFFMAGVVLAAVAALLRADRRRVLHASWAVAVVGLAAALVLSRSRVSGPTLNAAVTAWSGPALLVTTAAMVAAAVVGASGARVRVARSSFGWRQPASVVLAALAAAAPVLAAGWWVADGAGDPLHRSDPVLLPAFVAAQGERPERPRTLVLRPGPDRLAYALLRADGPRLGDAELAPAARGTRHLDEVVAGLASGRGGEAAADLLPFGVRFVLMSGTGELSGSPALVRAIDAVPGLVRISNSERSALWKVCAGSGSEPCEGAQAGRVRLIEAPAGNGDRADVGTVVPAGTVGALARVPESLGPRWVVLADGRHPGWRATFDGSPLAPRTYDGWAQAFVVPERAGLLEIAYDQGYREILLWVQLGALLLVVVLILPAARPRDDTDDGLGQFDVASMPRHARHPAQVSS